MKLSTSVVMCSDKIKCKSSAVSFIELALLKFNFTCKCSNVLFIVMLKGSLQAKTNECHTIANCNTNHCSAIKH